jgi:hypothetical protein
MSTDKNFRSFVFLSRSGCLLPLAIIFNSLFGWVFLKPKEWLIVEAILIIIFMLNGYIMTRKIMSAATVSKKRPGAIDVEAEVVEDKRKIGR